MNPSASFDAEFMRRALVRAQAAGRDGEVPVGAVLVAADGTLLAQAGIILHQTENESYEIYVRRSYADYLWHWLMDAGRGFGIAVQPP